MRRLSDARAWPEQLRLGDDFWLIAHNDSTGRPRLNPLALGLGLAGALLGELVLSGNIAVLDGRVMVLDERPPADAAAHSILEQVLAEPQHGVRTWLSFLGHSADQTVTTRLLRVGLVEREQDRRLFKTVVVHKPVDMSQAFWRAARLKDVLAGTRGQPTWQDVFLAGLIEATGLLRAVLWESSSASAAYLHHYLPRADPSLQDLVTEVATLVGDAVLGAHA
jgi:hypothetical protein